MRELNFSTSKKNFLPVVFDDNNKILVKTPTKGIVEKLTSMSDILSDLQSNADNIEALETLYEVAAEIMSNNVAKKEITSEYLEDMLDMQDIIVFFDEYSKMLNSITKSKN
ncbi:MAG: hypothetical protein OSJ61_14445 [Lachnospiraceae bacterium]|jgi:hypothetical protein|nr:hypothetical protein [Lachnospiraceae bacterium]